ncbi:MAG: hypothetical protein ABIL09_02780 [Gemmatimonadota bacterium]
MLAAGLALILARVALAAAQGSDPRAGAPPVYLIAGDRVRLVSPLAPLDAASGPWLQGVVVALDSVGLTLRPDRGEVLTIPHAAVARLQVRRRTRDPDDSDASTFGTLIGFAAGAAVGALACSSADGQDWVALRPQACGFAAGVAGAWLGARVALSGREERNWIPVALPLHLALGVGPRACFAMQFPF